MAKKKGNKKDQINKVSKETGISFKSLDRLNQETLQKLDDLVPDEDILGESESPGVDNGGGEDISDDSAGVRGVSREDAEEENSSMSLPSSGVEEEEGQGSDGSAIPDEVSSNSGGVLDEAEVETFPTTTIDFPEEVKERKLLGFHPITEKEIYSNE